MKILALDAPGLNPGFLGCYGNEWVATPFLDRLACDGVVFDQHIAATPILSGGLAPASAAGACIRAPKLKGFGDKLIAKAAAALAGHDVVVIDGPTLGPPWQLPHDLLNGYLEDEDPEEADDPWPDPPQGHVGMLDIAGWRRLRNTYAAVVTYFDAQVEALWEGLKAQALTDNLILAVTSRCGLALGEHGFVGNHPRGLYEERVHVPLLLALPDGRWAGRRTAALTQPDDWWTGIDMLRNATLDQVAAATTPSLWSLLSGQTASLHAEVMSVAGTDCPVEAALRNRDWALVLPLVQDEDPTRSVQLFVKPDDRWEMNDVRQQHMELAEEMEQRLRALLHAESMKSPQRC